MYSVYCDDVLVHDATSPAKEVHLISPHLKLGDSVAGTFDATIPPGNVGYNLFTRFNSTIVIKKESEIIWTGRVISENKDFFNQRKITAAGALSYLNDSNQGMQYLKNTSLLNFVDNLLTTHNSKVPSNRRITRGTITMTDPEEDFVYETNYGSTWSEFNESCLEKLGGHVRIRYNGDDPTPILDYLKDYPKTSPQEINFGSNLLDFTIDWDVSELATTIIPRGKQLDAEDENGQTDYVNIKGVNGGRNYVINAQAYNTYGRVEKVVDFSDCEDANKLLRLGQTYADSMQFDEMAMKINAIDLHHLTSSIVSFDLLDEVRCISYPHGLDKLFPITEIDIPLDDLTGVKYTMGTVTYGGISKNANKAASSVASAFRNLTPDGTILDLAKENATAILNQRTTGYISVVERDEQSQALIISDVPEWERATKYWKFDMNGLGYTKNGGSKYDLAITMDGTIVADFIKTGILSDGMGYNFWNLTTGEFSLANTASILDDNGDYTYINDVVNLARDVDVRRTGSENYFDGSSNFYEWRVYGNWTFDKENASFNANNTWSSNSLTPPAKKLKYSTVKGYTLCFSFEGVSNDEWGTIEANNCLRVTFKLVDDRGSQYASFDRLFTLDTSWKRKYTVVEMVNDSFELSPGRTVQQLDSKYLDVDIVNNSKHSITIRHVKLERGSVPTDWNVSTVDQDTYAYNVGEEAKSAAAKYTDAQKKALDVSLGQEEILKRLTNNFKTKGIFMQNKELYINASYVRTGTLDAGIVKAGILTDAKHRNVWNMVTGYLETTNAHFNNASVTGDFESGSYYKIRIHDGKMIGIKNGRQIGYIEPTSQSTYIPTGAKWDGIQLQASQCLRISTPHLAISSSSDTSVTCIVGYTGKATIPRTYNMRDEGGGSTSWVNGSMTIQCINGIVTSISWTN